MTHVLLIRGHRVKKRKKSLVKVASIPVLYFFARDKKLQWF